MKSFNLHKNASTKEPVIQEKMLKEQRENMEMCTESQKVDGKNINLSLPTKDKNNIIPFNVQLASARKEKDENQIIEAKMNQKETKENDKKMQITTINEESQKYDTKKEKAYKKAEDKDKNNTSFWDKYVGQQIEGEKTTVHKNVPPKGSQLPNNPERFKGKNIKKQIMASLKDADAMLFHIYAQAAKDNRNITENEAQQIIDINSGKMRIMSGMRSPASQGLESGDPKVVMDKDGTFSVIENDGKPCAKGYKSCRDAKMDFPEAEE